MARCRTSLRTRALLMAPARVGPVACRSLAAGWAVRVLLLLACLLHATQGLVIQLDRKAARLAVLIPFTKEQSSNVLESLKRWQGEGDPCPLLRRYEAKARVPRSPARPQASSRPLQHYVDIVFWYNRDFFWEDGGAFSEKFRASARRELKWMRSCFGRSKFLSAYLVDDGPQEGPSRQFFALYEPRVDGWTGAYDYFFLMEPDVLVIREGWLDHLWALSAFPTEFYIKGSILRGRRADAALRLPPGSANASAAAATMGHIDSCALYRLGNADFTRLVNETRAAHHPPSQPRSQAVPFERSLWQHLASSFMSPARWPLYQRYAHRLVYSEFIQNWGEELSAPVLADLRENYTDTYFVHSHKAFRFATMPPRAELASSARSPALPLPHVDTDYVAASPPPAAQAKVEKAAVAVPPPPQPPPVPAAEPDPELASPPPAATRPSPPAPARVRRKSGGSRDDDYFQHVVDPEEMEEAENAMLKEKLRRKRGEAAGQPPPELAVDGEGEEEEGEPEPEPEGAVAEGEPPPPADAAKEEAADRAAADAEPAYSEVDLAAQEAAALG